MTTIDDTEKLALLDALRHSIKYAATFLDAQAPWVVEVWTESMNASFALYKKLGGIHSLEKLK